MTNIVSTVLRFFSITLLCFTSSHVLALCTISDPLVINLRADTKSEKSCLNQSNVQQCIRDELREYYQTNPACLNFMDIYVPGTGGEDGNYNQFNWMFKNDTTRAHVSIMYENATTWDSATYDTSIINGTQSLKELLKAVEAEGTNTPVRSVRVFGHSKGSHIVSHVSTLNQNKSWLKFWAYALPGRTAVSIKKNQSNAYTGPLGTPGKIEKHNNNLVTITWLNDEVQLYTGNNHKGMMVPQAWEYPGYINDRRTRRGNVIENRIDHHDTYGGDSDLIDSSNKYEKNSKDQKYLATGDDSAYRGTKLKSFKPYFWGDADCRELAWQAMNVGTNEEVFDTAGNSQFPYDIGPSGPRGSGCQPSAGDDVYVKIRYLLIRKNKGYKTSFNLIFEEYSETGEGAEITRFSLPHSNKTQKDWQDFQQKIRLPYNFTIRIDPKKRLVKESKKNSKRNNTIHIAWVQVSGISNPASHRNDGIDSQYIIGPNSRKSMGAFEGQDHQKNLAGANKSGWKKHRNDTSNWKIYKSRKKARTQNNERLSYETLKITGDGNGSQEGFYKPVSLVD